MKQFRYFVLLPFLIFLINCHTNHHYSGEKPQMTSEFRKFAWIEGTWSDPEDSTHSFLKWVRKNDSLYSGFGWKMNGKDSISTEIYEISNNIDEILLSLEVIGKNDGSPDEYKLITNKNGEHVFESSEKEYPKRLIYILKPDGSMYFRMEGTSNGQSMFEEKKITKLK